MACCLTAPSHYPNQCWLIISKIRWYLRAISQEILSLYLLKVASKLLIYTDFLYITLRPVGWNMRNGPTLATIPVPFCHVSWHHPNSPFDKMSEIPRGRIALHWRHNQRDRWRLKSQAFQLLTQLFVQVQIKENIKAPRHWPLWGKFNGDRWISRTKSQWRGFFFIWWHHHTCIKKKVVGFCAAKAIA